MQPLPKAKLTEFVALGRKVGRQTAGLYLAEGQKVCAEALAAGQRPVALLLTQALADAHPEWAALAEVTYRVTDAQLARISTHAAPDGALAVLPCPVQPTLRASGGQRCLAAVRGQLFFLGLRVP